MKLKQIMYKDCIIQHNEALYEIYTTKTQNPTMLGVRTSMERAKKLVDQNQ